MNAAVAAHQSATLLIHAYAQIDDRIVWDIVESKLPVLSREVAALMGDEDESTS